MKIPQEYMVFTKLYNSTSLDNFDDHVPDLVLIKSQLGMPIDGIDVWKGQSSLDYATYMGTLSTELLRGISSPLFQVDKSVYTL